MNKVIKIWLSVLIVILSLAVISPVQAATSTATPITERVQSSSNLSQQELQDKVEEEKSKAQKQAEDTLVSEAQEAVKETQNAIA